MQELLLPRALGCKVIERQFPYGKVMFEADGVTEKCTAVVIGMTSFVGQRQDGLGTEIEHQVLQLSMCVSQIRIEFLIDNGEECVPVDADRLSRKRRFVPANTYVLLAAAKTLPEKFFPGAAVRAENNCRFFHALQHRPRANAFVVRVGHHDQCAFLEFSDSVPRQEGLGHAAIATGCSMSKAN